MNDLKTSMKENQTFIIWEVRDPRILNDNDSEVSKTVVFVGSESEAKRQYKQYKQGRKFAGSSHIYQTYPQPNISNHLVGAKEIIYPAKHKPPKEFTVSDEEFRKYICNSCDTENCQIHGQKEAKKCKRFIEIETLNKELANEAEYEYYYDL